MAKTKAKAKKAPKAAKTAVFVEEYKGKATFGIWNVDADGDKVGDYPLIAFGIKKAEALIEHLSDLEDYVESGGELRELGDDSGEEDDEDDEDEAPVAKKKKAKKEEPKKKKKPKIVRRDADSDEDE